MRFMIINYKLLARMTQAKHQKYTKQNMPTEERGKGSMMVE